MLPTSRLLWCLLIVSPLAFCWTQPTHAHGVHVDDDAHDADHQHEHDDIDTSFTGGLNDYLNDSGVWLQQRGFLALTTERVAALRDWNADFDQFVIRMIGEVTAIPPWEDENRLERLVGLLSERYQLDSAQQESVHDIIVRITTDWGTLHDDSLTACTLEAMEVRAAGELITPELVSLWTRQASEAIEDARERFTLATRRFLPQLRPEQRQRLLADIRVANQRLDALVSTAERWGLGEWSEEVWGLDQDPVQQRARAQMQRVIDQAVSDAKETPSKSAASLAVRVDDSSTKTAKPSTVSRQTKGSTVETVDDWARYVEVFIRRYALTEPQSLSAWRMHARAITLKQQADQRFAQRLEQLEQRGAEHAPRGQQLLRSTKGQRDNVRRELFERLKSQLELLPTRQQRQADETRQAQR